MLTTGPEKTALETRFLIYYQQAVDWSSCEKKQGFKQAVFVKKDLKSIQKNGKKAAEGKSDDAVLKTQKSANKQFTTVRFYRQTDF